MSAPNRNYVNLQAVSLENSVSSALATSKKNYTSPSFKSFLKATSDIFLKLASDYASEEESMDIQIGSSTFHVADKKSTTAIFLITQASAEAERVFDIMLNLNTQRLNFIDKATNLIMGA